MHTSCTPFLCPFTGIGENPEPPIHLVLGSEAAVILEKANAARTAEFEKWLPVTRTTDHDDAGNFLGSTAGKAFLERQK